MRFSLSPGTQLGICVSDHQKLEREARICRLLKHPNIGELVRVCVRGVGGAWPRAPAKPVGLLGREGSFSLLCGWWQ